MTNSRCAGEGRNTNPDSRVYVAGHSGLVGSALVANLSSKGYGNIVVRRSGELDLTDAAAVVDFFQTHRPEYVFLAAAKVGGIVANAVAPADFIQVNLSIALNVIRSAHMVGTKKLLFLGSSCIYPREAPQPIREEYLLSGPLEATNEAYAIAKIAGLKMCQAYRRQYGDDFISVMPTNLYGPGDNFHPRDSHVIPSLLMRFHHAKECRDPKVVVWGTGLPRREFLYSDDLADACVTVMERYDGETPLNVGTGTDVTIAQLASTIADVVGYEGQIAFDPTKPDGTPRKVLDVTRLNALGWRARTTLRQGLAMTYEWMLQQRRDAGSLRGATCGSEDS